jgi:hypothetical protein
MLRELSPLFRLDSSRFKQQCTTATARSTASPALPPYSLIPPKSVIIGSRACSKNFLPYHENSHQIRKIEDTYTERPACVTSIFFSLKEPAAATRTSGHVPCSHVSCPWGSPQTPFKLLLQTETTNELRKTFFV